MYLRSVKTCAAFFVTALMLFVSISCKKDKIEDQVTDSTVMFNTCPAYTETVDWMNDNYTYTATLKLKDSSQTLSGVVKLEALDSAGNFVEELSQQTVTFAAAGIVTINASGSFAAVGGGYQPVKYLFRLQFKPSTGTAFSPVDGTGCTHPSPFYVQDPLYGTARCMCINAIYDSVPADFVSFQVPVVMGLAGNSSSGYADAPASSYYWTQNYNGTQQISVYPNAHFTYVQSGFSTSPSRTIMIDNLAVPNASKAYVRFINLYDYDGMSLKVNGNFVSAFQSKDYLEYSGFEEVQPGSTNFAFHMDGLNYIIGTLNGVTLQAGKLYTVYHGGNNVPGAGNPKKLTPRIVMHN